MVGVVVIGHGNFASGNLSSVKLILGDHEKVEGIDFLEDDSTDMLKSKILKAIDHLGNEILILSDLAGGSPYNNSVVIKNERISQKIEVLAGTNLPMIISAILDREGNTLETIIQNVLQAGMDGINRFQYSDIRLDEVEEGI